MFFCGCFLLLLQTKLQLNKVNTSPLLVVGRAFFSWGVCSVGGLPVLRRPASSGIEGGPLTSLLTGVQGAGD